MGTLYKKVMKGKRTTYVPLDMISDKLDDGMTEGQIVNAVGCLAVIAINGYKMMLPPKSCTANRINSVQESVLKMSRRPPRNWITV